MGKFCVVSIHFKTAPSKVEVELGVVLEKWMSENKSQVLLPPKKRINSSASSSLNPDSTWKWHNVEFHGDFSKYNSNFNSCKEKGKLQVNIIHTDEYETARKQCTYFVKHGTFEETNRQGRGQRKKVPVDPYTPFEDSSEDVDDNILKPLNESDDTSEEEASVASKLPPKEPYVLMTLINPLARLVKDGKFKHLNNNISIDLDF